VSWGSTIEGKPIDEVQEVIALPNWDQNSVNVSQWEATNFEINPAVADQLHDYVTNIALMYREDNPFHVSFVAKINFQVRTSVSESLFTYMNIVCFSLPLLETELRALLACPDVSC